MQSFYVTTASKSNLIIIPDSEAHLNSHAIITYSYHIYLGLEMTSEEDIMRTSQLHLQGKTDRDYLGAINFDAPGRLFTYIADGLSVLTSDEVSEVIEGINHYRDNPSLWSID